MPPSRLSVITVVRNAAGTIGRCLESVASQQQRVEHIVIDGGSTDGTADIVRAFSPNLAWWCSEPDRGISDAFNKGLRRATGDIIGILNADDWYEPESLAVIRAAFEQNPETEIIHGRVRYWNGDVPVRVADGNHRALRKSGSVNHPSVFVRHSVYRQLGLFDCSYR
jgi:glycosyltransferase involved in cell wall biosynthesis